jgi:transposase
MAYSTLMAGPERRRRWSEDQKLAVLSAAFSPGASVAEVARQADICTSLIYRWRRAYVSAEAPSGFAPAVVMDTPASSAAGASRAEPAMVVELSCGARVSIASTASATLVTAALRALR